MMSEFMGKVKAFFGFIEEEETESVKQTNIEKITPPQRSFKGTLLSSSKSKQLNFAEIKVEEPRIYEDSLNIATNLRENIPVVINLKYLDSPTGKRLIDFVCGTAYAISGHMLKIAENIFSQ